VGGDGTVSAPGRRYPLLDMGEGDAIFIQTPSGRQVLVDGGPSEAVLLSQLGRQMPFWDRTLDVVVLMHPDYNSYWRQRKRRSTRARPGCR